MILYLYPCMCLGYIHRADKIIIIMYYDYYSFDCSCSCQSDLVCFITRFLSFHKSLSFLATNLWMVLDILKEWVGNN